MERVVGGRKVFAALGGRPFDPGLPAVVMVHGAGFDHTTWVLQTRYLADRECSVVAVDLPGHGRSEGPPLTSIGAMGDWVVGVLDALGAERATVVGHSMGGLVAVQAAADHPDRIERIALLGVADAIPVHPDLLAAAAADEPRAADLVARWSVSTTGHAAGTVHPGARLRESTRRLLERAAPGVLSADLRACHDRGSVVDTARRVACPVVVIAASADKMTPVAGARVLTDAFPSARLVVAEGSGHLMMSEAPDLVNETLGLFCVADTAR